LFLVGFVFICGNNGKKKSARLFFPDSACVQLQDLYNLKHWLAKQFDVSTLQVSPPPSFWWIYAQAYAWAFLLCRLK
jgi:hypothetical protein